MDRQLFTTLCLFALLLGFAALLGAVVLPFLPALGWAGVITVITFPLFRRLLRRLPNHANITAGIMTALVLVAIVLPMIGVVTVISQEAAIAYRFLEQLGPDGVRSELAPLLGHPVLLALKARFEPILGNLPVDIGAALIPAAKQVAGKLVGYSTTILKNVFGLLFHLFFMTITLFFCYRDGEAAVAKLWSRLPVGQTHRDLIEATVERVLQAVIFGIFLTCVVQGILGGIGFWVAGLPSPELFGAIMIVTAFIPVVGTAIIWAPGGLYLLLMGETAAGIGLLIWGGVVVGSIDNLIRPLFISGKAHLPILLVAIGALGGLLAFGLIGVVLGPLSLAIPLTLLEAVPPSETDPPRDGVL